MSVKGQTNVAQKGVIHKTKYIFLMGYSIL